MGDDDGGIGPGISRHTLQLELQTQRQANERRQIEADRRGGRVRCKKFPRRADARAGAGIDDEGCKVVVAARPLGDAIIERQNPVEAGNDDLGVAESRMFNPAGM